MENFANNKKITEEVPLAVALAVALLLPGFDDITTVVAAVSDDDEWEGVDLKKL